MGLTTGWAGEALAGEAPARPFQDRMRTEDAWSAYLREQDLTWGDIPKNFYQSPFMGNGGLGASMYRIERNGPLVFVLGDNRVRDHQDDKGSTFGMARLPIGHLSLDTVGDLAGADLRLSLFDATLTGTLTTTAGAIRIESFVHAVRDVLVINLLPEAAEAATWSFTPAKAESPRVKAKPPAPDGLRVNPDPMVETGNDRGRCVQALAVGGQTVTQWRTRPEEDGSRTLLVTVAHSYPDSGAEATAAATLDWAARTPLARLRNGHRQWWHEFYPKSFVSIPDARLQSFYWIQLYKMASATRREFPVLSTTAQWLEPTPWPATWWNLNVQLEYWLINATGHWELDSLTRSIDEYRGNLILNAPVALREDSAVIARSAQENLRTGTPALPGSTSGTPEIGNLPWAMHNLWLTYRHTMDDNLLREVIFPILRRAVNFYLHFVEEGADGQLHLPRTYSPEYDSTRDCNYDLALLTWGCATLLRACDRLGITDELQPRWREVLTRLVEPPQGSDGLWIGADRRLTSSHRHYSHLLWFYPLYLFDPTDPARQELLQRSLDHWVGFEGALQGYTFTGASSMSSSMGQGNKALSFLNTLLDRYVQPNTMYRESGPVIETPLSAAQSVHDMLLQSWGDTIRVFPAMPDAWSDAVIHQLRAEGAFVISARRTAGRTAWVRVQSLAGEPCRLHLPGLVDGPITIRSTEGQPKSVVWHRDGEILVLQLAAGDDVVITTPASPRQLEVSPVPVTGQAPWGLAPLPPIGVTVPADLSALFDNDGVSPRDAMTDGDFDGSGYTYPAEEVPASGRRTIDRVTWLLGSYAPGAANNVVCRGQQVELPAGNAANLHILGAGTGGGGAAKALLTYLDGSTAEVDFKLTDWARTPSYGETIAVEAAYRHSRTGVSDTKMVRWFHQVVAADPSKTLVAVTLPVHTKLHVFGLSVEAP
ncbi:glycoside hydrolase family 95-like protein [Micromonospora sp. NPDC047738]|uniref:glycosyl hydrolase family 95 catalytic domain-containing protein n=1 Tax=Micromonospora sp. NPDC047738 TaxID=3155741 RepID=UPI0033D9CA6B